MRKVRPKDFEGPCDIADEVVGEAVERPSNEKGIVSLEELERVCESVQDSQISGLAVSLTKVP